MERQDTNSPGDADLRERLAQALRHPQRWIILGLLAERPASAAQIAAQSSYSRESVGHQLRRLRSEGLVEIDSRRPRRGTAEIVYRATVEPYLDDGEYADLDPAERRKTAVRLFRVLRGDAARALRGGTFGARDDSCLCHMRMLVDEEGWRELATIHREAFERSLAVRRSAAERIAERPDAETIAATSTILCFELPEIGAPADDSP